MSDNTRTKVDILVTTTALATWLEINSDPPLSLNLDHIVAYKKVAKGKTAVWMLGQSAVDGGFLVDVDYDVLIETVAAALRERVMANDGGGCPGCGADMSDDEGELDRLADIAMRRNNSN